MFKYITNTQFREAHKFLSQYCFLQSSMKFSKTGFSIIRYALQRNQRKKTLSFFSQCFKILQESKKKPNQMIKVLFFIHLILQNEQKKSNEMLDLFTSQLQEILQYSRQYCEMKHQMTRVNQMTMDKNEADKNNIVSGRDKQIQNNHSAKQNRAVGSINYNLSQNQDNDQQPQTAVTTVTGMNKNYQISSPKQVICQKLVQPYALYLLKKCAVLNMYDQTDQNVSLWTEINMFKLIFNICEVNSIVPRYYRKKYLEMVLNLIQVLNMDIHKIYVRLTKKTREKIGTILKKISLKQLKLKIRNQQSGRILKRGKSNQNLHAKGDNQTALQISQAQQLLKQIGQINDKMIYIYWDKYVSNQLFMRNITIPILMKIESAQFQQIFSIIKQQQKKAQSVRKYSAEKINDKKLNILRNLSGNKIQNRNNLNDTLQTPLKNPPKYPKNKNINDLGSAKTHQTACSIDLGPKKNQQFI